ncbi:PREDICTED: uncharacterized protein LOC109353612 isoform X1 [Lupinus angustifolius]|nr:PREDICTED: uncharacterized protein LOC109353612 isoform X1 [Lupinus angustifolius]
MFACPMEDMESVVATVSGYHGSERRNLIKMISHAGANYVGRMMPNSITHVVCWKFEGKKFDIAQKFNIIVVNHRWIEDCIKEGRRVPEDSYVWQSGHEVGPLLLKVPPPTVQANNLRKKKVINDRSCDTGSEKQTTELSSGASGNSVWEDFLMNKHEESSSNSSRRSRKQKRNICNDHGVSNVAGPSRKGRRTARNIVDEAALDTVILDLTREEDHLSRVNRLQTDAAATSSPSVGVNNEKNPENREGAEAGLHNQSGTVNIASNGIEQIKDSNNVSTNRNSILFEEDPLPIGQTSVCSGAESIPDGDQIDNVGPLPTSKELSCVICFEEYSSTRGILPCGHRYCYQCIQSWVDRRTSMGKSSTCPLCKASFVMFKKVEHAVTADQKVYSQTIPSGDSTSDIFINTVQEFPHYGSESSACVVCRGREPEDLLQSCDVCQHRRIHLYCLDPPLLPWTCSHCKDLRRLYHHHSY